MKQIYVLRHANKNKETGELTDEGREKARELRNVLGLFNLVITSDKQPRLVETARLLTGEEPIIDKRAGIVYSSEEQHKKLGDLAKIHPLNHAGAMYEFPEFESLAIAIGKDLLSLISETFEKLPENGRALIVAQDAVMVAAEKHINKKPYQKLEKAYKPLEGFIIDETLSIEEL
jgi:broad specificity phosphatase PhoE